MNHEYEVINSYFDWLYTLVRKNVPYRKLLSYLHSVEFIYSFVMDENRAADGINLRWIFSQDTGYDERYLTGPCSVLEMMISLSMSMENIMDDPAIGDRTAQWFWGMIVNLGLGAMMDDRFDRKAVEEIVDRFLHHDYEPNGKGGLFTLRHCDRDARDMDIWCQVCAYLDEIM